MIDYAWKETISMIKPCIREVFNELQTIKLFLSSFSHLKNE